MRVNEGRRWLIAVYAVVVASFATSPVGGATPAPDRAAATGSPAIVPFTTRTGTQRSRPARRGAPQASSPERPEVPPAVANKDLDLSPAVLKSAFDAADEDYARSTSHVAFGTDPASRQAPIDRAFDAAHIDECGSGALAFDPPPVYGDFMMGMFAVPYPLHPVATGRCKP